MMLNLFFSSFGRCQATNLEAASSQSLCVQMLQRMFLSLLNHCMEGRKRACPSPLSFRQSINTLLHAASCL